MSLPDWTSSLLIGSFCFSLSLWLLCHFFLLNNVVYISDKKRHWWKSISILQRACYCSICEVLLSPSIGVFCECCGVCCHPGCTKTADSKFRCKEKYLKSGKSITHLWVKGNLPLNIDCHICKKDIDYHATSGLFGYRCCWCQRILHNHCFKKFNGNQECDFGPYRDMIFPPNCIVPARTRGSMKLHLATITPPTWENWKPLIVIANTKAGSNTASDVISLLRGILHPLQVMEMGNKGPQEALQWAVKTSPKQCRILVAGGDGSVGWVLNTIFSLNIRPIPEVSIMPLGTGNDLSRVMRWGSEPPDELDPFKILNNIKSASCVSLDRWILEVETIRYRLPIKRAPVRTYYIYNYFSIGVDALVALNFHKTRESRFYILSSRFINKLLYFGYGTQQIVQRDCENLEKRLDLYIDNKLMTLPELQSIVFLNIDSWGAGVKLCELSQSDSETIEHSISDGVLEVFGIVSSFHIAQLQVGIGRPVRIGQGKHVKIHLKQSCPVQADGEPWNQSPCEMHLQARSQAKLLKCSNHSNI